MAQPEGAGGDLAARVSTLRAQVRLLFDQNRQRGAAAWSDARFDFVAPSSAHYPFQWLWDSCFHAVILAHLDPPRARSEIRTLLVNQHADGRISHMTLWERDQYEHALTHMALQFTRSPYLSDISQTPVLAQALERLHELAPDQGFLEETLPQVVRFYRWWKDVRDPDNDDLVAIIQPDESGMDASPRYDRLMGLPADASDEDLFFRMGQLLGMLTDLRWDPARLWSEPPFLDEDVLVNAAFADGCASLERLCQAAGLNAGADWAGKQARATARALVAKCWDDEACCFWDLAGRGEEPQRVLTVAALVPITCEGVPAEVVRRVVAVHLSPGSPMWPRFPVPSVSPGEPSFRPGAGPLWRGPSWMATNWLLWRGLRRHGYGELARLLAARSLTMVETGGLREYWDPFEGTGYGAEGFTWGALVLDMLADEVAPA